MSALLHDPAGTTRRVQVKWSSRGQGTLCIENSPDSVIEVAAAGLSISRGGWRGDAVTFAWKTEGRTWAITVDDASTIAGLIEDLPRELSQQIQEWQKRTARDRRWSRVALTVAAVLTLLPLLLLIALFVMRDRVVDAVVSRIPTYLDAEIGETMYRQLADSGELVKDGPAVDAVLAVSRRFIPYLPADGFTFRFEVVNASSVNAYATPGGLIVVHTGLLAKADSADQLAGVLSHEIVHVTRRHSMRQLIYNLGLPTIVSWSLGIPDGASVTLANAAAQLGGLKFSRDQESEADSGGIDLLQRASLPAGGLQSFFASLAGEKENVPAFLSTHPPDAERLAALEKLLSDRGSWKVELLDVDWSTVRRDAESRMKKP